VAVIEPIKNFEQLKVLADARRLAILRRLMAAPATLTHLGHALGEHPAWIRHHLKQLERVGLVEMVDVQVTGGFVEKYYRARSRAFIFQELILPDNPSRETVLLSGSHDLAVELLAQAPKGNLDLIVMPVGSLDGLVALRQGICQIAGSHLMDPASGEFNTSYVRHLFPDREMSILTLAEREQGLLVLPGNPRQILGIQDLVHENVTLVNRNRGSGTRLWLDTHFQRSGIQPEQVRGYQYQVRTHTDVALAICQGRADAGLGIRAAARQFGLDFIPLFQERYDLVLAREQLENTRIHPLFEYLVSKEFRRNVEALGGYNTTRTGNRTNL
jgi:putative molybdopterin biosynthesis protein